MATAVREAWDRIRADYNDLGRIIQESGQRLAVRQPSAAYLARLTEAMTLIAGVQKGTVSSYWLQEALSTSDFPLLMGDILDRQLLGKYAETVPTWRNYCKVGTVRDFRTVRRIALDGLEGRYYPNYPKPELVPGKEDNSLDETGYTYAVEVYEKKASINWRMLVNDDLDGFTGIPDRLARGARRTEEHFATVQFVDASGPHASLYTVGNRNIINATNAGAGFTANNPPLSLAALQQGMAVMAQLRDADGEPISIDAVELVVPPTLKITAMNIMNATEAWIGTASGDTMGGGSAAQQIHVANWMRSATRLSVNTYIPVVASGANGGTSWFLFANPDSGRPAVEIGFLRGYEQPGLYQKAPNTVRVGGGGADPTLGDFETGELTYKGMHIIGGTRMDAKATVASNGSGS